MTDARIDFCGVAALLADRAEDVIDYLHGAYPRDRGGIYYCSDAFGGAGTSTTFWLKNKRGEWFDHAAREGGDLLTLWKIVRRHSSMHAAAIEAMGWLGKDFKNDEDRQKHLDEVRARQAQRDREEAEKNERRKKSAFGHYMHGEPLIGLPSDEYLLGRGIDIQRLGKHPGAFRHKEMKCPETGELRPCLIAAVSLPVGGFLTIHRHFLDVLDDGRVVKADHPQAWKRMVKAKQCYGSKQGGIIPVWRGSNPKPFHKLKEPEIILCCEGIEDALSWAIVEPSLRIWSMIDLGNFGMCDFGGDGFAGRPREILWHRHRGDGPGATKAFEVARDKVEAMGIAVTDLWAPGDAKDINEWLQAQPEYLGRAKFRKMAEDGR